MDNEKNRNYLTFNKAKWDELAPLHFDTDFYDVKSFREGRNSLKNLEIGEIGSVENKKLLHLQCHFGMDSLSWERLGATVTGIDFSDKAIKLANQLRDELGLSSKFICSDVLSMPNELFNSFDIVFTSYGTITWLPDLEKWAERIFQCLKTGGFFYIVDSHPFSYVFQDEDNPKDYQIGYPYFIDKPYEFSDEGSYAGISGELSNKKNYQWIHSMSYIVNSLINAGLTIEFIHEFPFTHFQNYPFLEESKEGFWIDKNSKFQMPLMFSLKARKI
ncbi:MAG: class I SAM-dependent methyltransferase [Candidatus Kariarchaeaceae archaeon]|jgi:SAM-dependent methyltransferase